MRHSSAAAEAIICSFRSISPMGTKTLAGDRLAEIWVQVGHSGGMRSPYAARGLFKRRIRR